MNKTGFQLDEVSLYKTLNDDISSSLCSITLHIDSFLKSSFLVDMNSH